MTISSFLCNRFWSHTYIHHVTMYVGTFIVTMCVLAEARQNFFSALHYQEMFINWIDFNLLFSFIDSISS